VEIRKLPESIREAEIEHTEELLVLELFASVDLFQRTQPNPREHEEQHHEHFDHSVPVQFDLVQ